MPKKSAKLGILRHFRRKNIMIKILFICHGNICRSPMAEMIFKHMIKERHLQDFFYVNSAATSREEIGCGIHRGTKRKLAEAGIPCSEHYAVQVTKADYDKYDYLILMDARNQRELKWIIKDDPQGKIHMLLDFAGRYGESIADPWYTGDFDITFDEVMEGCKGLLEHIMEER